MKAAYKLLIFSTSTLLLGLAGLICGMVADNWFVATILPDNKVYFGLLRLCVKGTTVIGSGNMAKCFSRTFLEFSDEYVWYGIPGLVLDQIFTLLMTSAFSAIIAFGLMMTLAVFYSKKRYMWRVISLTSFFFLGISGILSLSATGVSEHSISEPLRKTFKPSWASTMAWCGTACVVISATATFFMIFLPASDEHKSDRRLDPTNLAPIFTLTNGNTTLHTNEDLYADLYTSGANFDMAALHMDFYGMAAVQSLLPPPPSYAEASRSMGKPPAYEEDESVVNNPYAV